MSSRRGCGVSESAKVQFGSIGVSVLAYAPKRTSLLFSSLTRLGSLLILSSASLMTSGSEQLNRMARTETKSEMN